MKMLKGVVVGAAVALLSGMSQAATVLSSDGIDWSWTSSDSALNSGTVTLHAHVADANALNGGLAAYLQSFEFKLGDQIVDSASAGSAWTWSQDELDATNGCEGPGSTGHNMCFYDASPASISNKGGDFDLNVAFDLAGTAILGESLHLKVLWITDDDYNCTKKLNKKGAWTQTDCNFTKTGSLISQDFDRTVPPPVPLPGTLGLLGLGLAGLGAVRRKQAA